MLDIVAKIHVAWVFTITLKIDRDLLSMLVNNIVSTYKTQSYDIQLRLPLVARLRDSCAVLL